jgi:CheY-like chemotaxis protein
VPSEPILSVDDNAVNLKLARLLLTAEGHDARTQSTSSRRSRCSETFEALLSVMAIQLPVMMASL